MEREPGDALREVVARILEHRSVEEERGAVLLGRPGRGKTHLAIAMAYRAIQDGYEAVFETATALLGKLHKAQGPRSARGSARGFLTSASSFAAFRADPHAH